MPAASFNLQIAPATVEQVPLILGFIKKLADYEKLIGEVVADEATLREYLFGPEAAAEVILAYRDHSPVGFAVFFTTFSTFVGRPGIYLEDLFVEPESRGLGIGKAILSYLAKTTLDRGYRRLSWAVLDWNQPSIDFYKSLGALALDDWTVYRLSGDALQKLAGTP